VIPTFDQWIQYIFDHPVTDPAWYWEDNWAVQYDPLPPGKSVEYLTRLFKRSQSVLGSYSDGQMDQGLDYLINVSCGDYFRDFFEPSVPWPKRRGGIRSVSNLFRELFAKRCTPHLSHLDEPGVGPLNSVCYMWWDIAPLPMLVLEKDGGSESSLECLGVMQDALALDSVACQESALYGLGHYATYCPNQVHPIIDSYLKGKRKLRKELRSYAENAREGAVL